MKKNIQAYISILISAIAIVMALIAICNVYPRNLDFDYLGLITGLLGLITAILLGWQIYSIFNIKELEQKLESLKDDAYKKTEDSLIEFHGVMASTLSAQLKTNYNEELFINYILNSLHIIIHLHNMGRYDLCELNINKLLLKIRQTEKLKSPIHYQAGLTALCAKVAYLPHVRNSKDILDILLVIEFGQHIESTENHQDNQEVREDNN